MSCFVRVATQLKDEVTLREAVNDLGYKIADRTYVNGYDDNTVSADLVIDIGGSYDVGAVRTKGGAYDLVADWEMARLSQTEFVGKVTQAYGVVRVKAMAKKSGFVVAQQKVDEKGSVRMTLRRFA